MGGRAQSLLEQLGVDPVGEGITNAGIDAVIGSPDSRAQLFLDTPNQNTFSIVISSKAAPTGTGLVFRIEDNGTIIITGVNGGTITGGLTWNSADNTLNLACGFGLLTRITDHVSIGKGESIGTIGFYESDPVTIQTVTGSKGGNAALASLMAALALMGLVKDTTT